jgi:hypothetical protein
MIYLPIARERAGNRQKHFASVAYAVYRNAPQRVRHSRLDGAAWRSDKPSCGSLWVQPNPTMVVAIALASKKTLSDQSLEDSGDSGDRARVQMDDARKFSSRETWTRGHDSKDEPLRTSDSESHLHPFRGALQPMLDTPQ